MPKKLFQKGQCPNPNGRPKGGFSIDELFKAIKRRQKVDDRRPFLEHLVDRAYKNDKVLLGVAKKILPDLVDNVGGDAVEQILMMMLRKRAELTNSEPNLMDLKPLDKPKVQILESNQDVKEDK